MPLPFLLDPEVLKTDVSSNRTSIFMLNTRATQTEAKASCPPHLEQLPAHLARFGTSATPGRPSAKKQKRPTKHQAHDRRPAAGGHRAVLYLFSRDGSLHANDFSEVRLPHEVNIALSANRQPFTARIGNEERQATAMLISHSLPHTIDARGHPYLTVRVPPTHPAFRRLAACGAQTLRDGLFDALEHPLNQALFGHLTLADALRLFDAVIATACRELPTVAPLDARVRDALLHIGDRGEASLDEVATVMGVSLSRTSHLFTEHLGMSLRSYLMWQRMNKLWALLTSSQQLTLTELAHRLGFADSSHLTRNFRSLTGYLPSEVRNGALIRIVQEPPAGGGLELL